MLIDSVEDKKDLWLIYELCKGKTMNEHLFEVKGEFYKGERIYMVHHGDFYHALRTNINLMRDFIKHYDITWEEEFEEDDRLGENPIITGLEIGCNNAEVWIYEIDPTKDRQVLLGHFNFFRDCEDEVLDFIQDNYRRLEMEEIDESIKIHRFNDYK